MMTFMILRLCQLSFGFGLILLEGATFTGATQNFTGNSTDLLANNSNSPVFDERHLENDTETGPSIQIILNNSTGLHMNQSAEVNEANVEAKDVILNTSIVKNTSSSVNETEPVADHSGFNLAIIPVLAVFFFLIIFCLKCCSWFRSYTRGNDKNDTTYAVIVENGDEEYDPIDIMSESASTAFYDTISSFSSFLKRSGNDNTISSIRSLGPSSQKDLQSPNKELWRRLMRADLLRNIKNQSERSPEDGEGKCVKSNTVEGNAFRMSSTSSEETTSELLPDSPVFKRNNRFRVSFVTEKPGSKSVNTSNQTVGNNNISKADTSSQNNVIKSSIKSSPNSVSADKQDITKPKVDMIDKGTQTRKSFRYSLKKVKRHKSESDANDRTVAQIHHNFQQSHSCDLGYHSEHACDKCVDTKTRTLSFDHSVIHSSLKNLCEKQQQSEVKQENKTSKYPVELNVKSKLCGSENGLQSNVDGFGDNGHKTEASCLSSENGRFNEEDEVFETEKPPSGMQYRNNIKLCDSCQCNKLKSNHAKVGCLQMSKSEGDIYRSQKQQYSATYVCASCRQNVENSTDKKHLNNAITKHCGSYNRLDPKESGTKCKTCKTAIIHGNSPRTKDKLSSIISLESSGYAELSSSESICY